MKQKLLLLMAALSVCACMSASGDKPVAFDKLPETAREFVTLNFSDETFSYATKDTDFVTVTYDVVLSGGTSIEFNSKGEWTKIENKVKAIDPKFVAPEVRTHVEANYPGNTFLKVEKSRLNYEVDLSNGLELTYDLKFNLVGIDD